MKDNMPFIKLFKTINGFYFFDVNRDTIVTVNSSIYDYLNGDITYDELSHNNQICIDKLRDSGFLSSKHISKIEHPKTRDLEYQLNNRCEQIVLQVTQSCNLVCFYCPYANKTGGALQRDHSNKMMSWETAKACLDFYTSHSTENEDAHISFYGGEPLIAFSLIKKCVEYANEILLGKNIHYSMTTNGTLLTDEMIDFFVEHDFDLMFSIDGPEAIHDINRKRCDGSGSFEKAYENLKKVAKAFGKNRFSKVSINMVLNPKNDVDEVFSLFDDKFLSDYNISATGGVADDDLLGMNIDIAEDFQTKMSYQYFLGYLDYLNIVSGLKIPGLIKAYFLDLEKTYLSFKKPSDGLPDIGCPGGPCVPGQRRVFADVDGVFYPCERVSEVSEAMKIGNVTNGFNLEKANAILNIGQLTNEKCKNCYAIMHCQLCARVADDCGRLSGDEKLKHCKDSYSKLYSDLLGCALIKESRTLYKRKEKMI